MVSRFSLSLMAAALILFISLPAHGEENTDKTAGVETTAERVQKELSKQVEEFKKEMKSMDEKMSEELCSKLRDCCTKYKGACCDALQFCEKK